MNPRIFIAALLVILGAATACSASPNPPAPTQPSASPVTALAFRTADHMHLADSNGRIFGDVELSKTAQGFVWSMDSRHVAWLDKSRLHVVDAATGADRSQPCPCNGLAPFGAGFGTISSDGAALLTFDGTGTAERIALHNPLTVYARVVAGGKDQVAVTDPLPEEEADYRGQSALSAIDRTGNSRPMIAGKSGVALDAALESPGGTRLAAEQSPSSGACWPTAGILSLQTDAVNPVTEPLVPTGTQFDRAVLEQSRVVTGMSWAGDALITTFGPLPNCEASYPGRYVTYSLTGNDWQFLQAGSIAVAFGADGRSYHLDYTDHPPADPDEGKLVLTGSDGVSKVLAEHVLEFAATPAEQRNGKPVVAPPPAEKATTDHGAQIAPALLDLVQQMTKALDTNDATTLDKLCARCDLATRTLLGTPAGRKSIRDSLRTHPAMNKDSATFPSLADASCADDPQARAKCTAEQIVDIGVLHLKGDYGIEVSGLTYHAPTSGSVRLVLDTADSAHWAGQSISAQSYRVEASYAGAPESYFFQSPDGRYTCGFDAEQAACQGPTQPIPPRPAACPEGPGWGHGMTVTAKESNFLCAGGVIFYPTNRNPEDRDRLAVGQTISALGFTCTGEQNAVSCTHDGSGHRFRIAPDTNAHS